MAEIIKPTKHIKEYFDFFEVEEYIVSKYNCENDKEKTWDYMCNILELGNDSYSYIPTRLNNTFTNAVKDEFGEDPEVWISW